MAGSGRWPKRQGSGKPGPSLAETIEHFTAESFDDRFTYGIDLILTGHSGLQDQPASAMERRSAMRREISS